MRTERSLKVMSVLALVVSVCALSVGFAVFSQNLTINGTADIETSKWDIHFENLSDVVINGENASEVTKPTINSGTSIENFDIKFKNHNSSATYTFDVKNAGTYDAKISDIIVNTPTCTGTGENAETDASNVCNNLTYTFTYADGSAIGVNDTLTVGETKSLKLVLTYGQISDASLLPTDTVSVGNLEIALNYIQN